jgi:hypothetical protein
MVFCSIKDIKVKPYERQNKHVWYPIQIELENHDTIEIKRRYSEFIQFAQQLKAIDKTAPQMNHSKTYYWIKRHQHYMHRQTELERFCKDLLSLPTVMTSSDIYISFFNLNMNECYNQHVNTSTSSHHTNISASSHSTSVSTSSHSTNISTISYSSHCNSSQKAENRIRIKLVYDCENIVVLCVPRSTDFDTMKWRIIQKFALLDIRLSSQLILLSVSNHKQISSPACSVTENVMLVSNQTQWKEAMRTRWMDYSKVTVRVFSF